MSLTALLWIGLFVAGTIMALRRPVWGVVVYMLTFFAGPAFWWWGKPLAGYRWNLYGGIILLIAVAIRRLTGPETSFSITPGVRRVCWIAACGLVNATFVHFVLAESQSVSEEGYTKLIKFVLLFFMIILAIETPGDLRIALLALVLGAGYIGYEATINERGRIVGGRLEGVGAPDASQSNELASLLVTILPLAAVFAWAGKLWHRPVAFAAAPLALNTVILCNSRGGFLAAITSGVAFVAAAPGRARRQTLVLVGLGAVATWLLLGDAYILERFQTTFAPAEVRDQSAEGRLTYWKAGLRMIGDHPLGAGGSGFSRVHGPSYIREVSGEEFESRSVHNGYINEACEWGIQGLALRLLLFLKTLALLLRTTRITMSEDDWGFEQMVGSALAAGMTGFLVSALFGDFLDNEWGYWCAALAAAHARLVDVTVEGKTLTKDGDAGELIAEPQPLLND